MEDLARRVRSAGRAAGLDVVGVADAGPFPEVATTLWARRRQGLHGRLAFTFVDPATATDVRLSFPWAERLVVGGRSYLPAAGTPGPAVSGTGRIARFAASDAYVPLRAGLEAAAAALSAGGFRTEVLIDDNRLVDRAAAFRAGLGWWGKNSMLLAPGFGPWLLVGSVVTDARLAVDAPSLRDCGSCSACLPACPTGALVAPGVLDARRCLAAIAQSPGLIPRRLRPALGDRLYGCDDCLTACPPGVRLATASISPNGRVSLGEILGAADRTLEARFSHFYLPDRRVRILRRNALVVLGNQAEPASLPLLAGYLGHPDWLLRAHSAWALGELRGGGPRSVLRRRFADETHPEVRREIEWALVPEREVAEPAVVGDHAMG